MTVAMAHGGSVGYLSDSDVRFGWSGWSALSNAAQPILRKEDKIVVVGDDDSEDVQWLWSSIEALNGLLDLNDADDDWYSTPQPAVVVDALLFLASVLPSDAPAPSFSPLNGGGVQAEWHRGGLDVELIFSTEPEERGIYVRDKATGESREFALDSEAFVDAVENRLFAH